MCLRYRYILLSVTLALLLVLCSCAAPSDNGAPSGSAAGPEVSSETAGPEPEPASLTLSEQALTLAAGRTAQLSAVRTPEPSGALSLDWSSSDAAVASVSAAGEVTAHAPGSAVLSAQTPDGLSASCAVTVVPLEEFSCALTVSLSAPLSLEETVSLPEGNAWEEIVWHSSAEQVASAEGAVITALRFGSATLTGEGPTVQLTCEIQTTYGGQLIAHRGLSAGAPENTLPAFRLAGEAGAWGIETDLHVTADGVFVCLHDDEIDGMTDGSGAVAELTYAEIQACQIDAGNHLGDYPPLYVPTLEEYLAVCRAYGAVAVIELKEDFPDSEIAVFCQLLEEQEMTEQCVCISFRLSLLRALREVSTEIPVQYIVRTADREDVDLAASLGNSGIDFRSASADLIDYARSLGCTTNVWTVDSPEEQQSWREAGIDFITSNNAATAPPDGTEDAEE